MNKFVIGDIHGAYRALIQCLEKARFDYENDRLICIGDVYDGWSEARQSVDELLKIRNLVYILGNHDQWTLDWALTGKENTAWLFQGGIATIVSYQGKMIKRHKDFLINAKLYHVENNKLFVHAGIIPGIALHRQDREILTGDRTFVEVAYTHSRADSNIKFTKYNEVYVGHTPTLRYGMDYPLKCGEIWLMDTGAGWNGRLTIMNVDTKEYFQSDPTPSLYPIEKGRFK
jgi:serine/threonine protein phosphatase 1